MVRMHIVSEIMMPDREQRYIPFLFTAMIYITSGWLIFRNPKLIDYHISDLLFLVAGIMLITALISKFWKISAHATAMGGLLGVLFRLVFCYYGMDYIYALAISLVCTGIVMTARLYLGAHDSEQVTAGVILGGIYAFFSTYLLF